MSTSSLPQNLFLEGLSRQVHRAGWSQSQLRGLPPSRPASGSRVAPQPCLPRLRCGNDTVTVSRCRLQGPRRRSAGPFHSEPPQCFGTRVGFWEEVSGTSSPVWDSGREDGQRAKIGVTRLPVGAQGGGSVGLPERMLPCRGPSPRVLCPCGWCPPEWSVLQTLGKAPGSDHRANGHLVPWASAHSAPLGPSPGFLAEGTAGEDSRVQWSAAPGPAALHPLQTAPARTPAGTRVTLRTPRRPSSRRELLSQYFM